MDRRELLKLFGVGAMVVPVIGETPQMEAAANLIEVPKVELANKMPETEFKATDRALVRGNFSIRVIIEQAGQPCLTFAARSFLTNVQVRTRSFRGSFDIASSRTVEWTLEGCCLSDHNETLSKLMAL